MVCILSVSSGYVLLKLFFYVQMAGAGVVVVILRKEGRLRMVVIFKFSINLLAMDYGFEFAKISFGHVLRV